MDKNKQKQFKSVSNRNLHELPFSKILIISKVIKYPFDNLQKFRIHF